MTRMIAGGTGFIGQRLTKHWLKRGHEIVIVSRSKKHVEEVFGDKVRAVTWTELTAELVNSMEVVVNLAGVTIGGKRWSDARKAEILDSRIETTRQIAELLSIQGKDAPTFLNASAIGVYGLQIEEPTGLPEPFTETATINWQVYPDFLSEVGRRWESAAKVAVEKGVRVIFMRFGVVLAKSKGALPELMRPIRYGIGKIGSGKQPFTWIAIDDLIRAIDFVLDERQFSGPINMVAPQAVAQANLAQILAKLSNKEASYRLPGFLVKLMFGQMGTELLLRGQNVYPEKLLELGFRFHYADIETALNHVLQLQKINKPPKPEVKEA